MHAAASATEVKSEGSADAPQSARRKGPLQEFPGVIVPVTPAVAPPCMPSQESLESCRSADSNLPRYNSLLSLLFDFQSLISKGLHGPVSQQMFASRAPIYRGCAPTGKRRSGRPASSAAPEFLQQWCSPCPLVTLQLPLRPARPGRGRHTGVPREASTQSQPLLRLSCWCHQSR